METAIHNVVGLHAGSVWEDIQTFIGQFISKNTQGNYSRSLEQFFMWYRGKKLNELVADDLPIRNADMIKYQKYLREHEADYTNATINNVIEAIRSLYRFLKINDYEVNPDATKVKPLPNDSERCGELYVHEAEEWANIVLATKKGQEKSALIRLAYTTSFRKASLLAIEWDDIKLNLSGNYYEVTVVGKGGKKHTVAISIELYNELLKIKEQKYYARYNDNKIFHLSLHGIQDMIDYLREETGIPPERNIKFHSLRNVASMFGTLEEAKRHYNHSSIVVTEKSYRHKDKDMSNSISLRIGKEIDYGVFEELSKDQLIELIKEQEFVIQMGMEKRAKEVVK
ncbi:Site-specific recombinase XerD [Paenibacillus sophorae]|uniref:Site-specific recombinase XerD n=1 Tax=Paenibacillus sophorae TaxID=1333845 RepID=A0A1H8JL03_9BACL|nr:tyrosine-type recombinase/integrase [Paenibacillus sophorae]QWU13385.1 tyrosine-type recombinase/integrase [Paenibacillus sophorae]SEN80957.1 Site-specific recombinase XerD [Paenibacillus sophorae]